MGKFTRVIVVLAFVSLITLLQNLKVLVDCSESMSNICNRKIIGFVDESIVELFYMLSTTILVTIKGKWYRLSMVLKYDEYCN